MQLFRRLTTTLLLALPVVLVSTGTWAQDEEEKNYYLEQMRKKSQASEQEPGLEMPAEDDSDLIAGSDTDASAQYSDSDYSDVGDIKPNFEKPKLEPYKPEQ